MKSVSQTPVSCCFRFLAPFALAVVLRGSSSFARTADEQLESAMVVARQAATSNAAAAAVVGDLVKADTARHVALLDSEMAAAKTNLAQLQQDLLTASTHDDPAAIKTVRARLAARRTALEAAESEKALWVRQGDEAERERDVWKKRAATLELALRLDMKVMLAGPADIQDRGKRVDTAAKEIDNQLGQIRKYAARRTTVAVELSDAAARRKALAKAEAPGDPEDLRNARRDETRELERLMASQDRWFRLNKQLEDRARRNLAFARTDYLTSLRYAEALGQKAGLQQAEKAAAAADVAEGRLAEMRAAMAPLQQRATAASAEAARLADAALKALGETHTARNQEEARAAYAAAEMRKSRADAENDAWKEFGALQKAGASFARELADRFSDTAGDLGIHELTQNARILRESLDTSELYIRNLNQLIERTGGQIDSARRDLGLDAAAIDTAGQALNDLFADFDAARPPAPDALAACLQSLIDGLPPGTATNRLDSTQRSDACAALVARLAQREMLRHREAISERWLENSRATIRNLDTLAAARLWRQHDPRLNATALAEAGTLTLGIVRDAGFAWDAWRLDRPAIPGLPSMKRLLRGFGLVILVGLIAWLAGRAIPTPCRWSWCAGRLVSRIPPLAAAAVFAIRSGHGNLAFLWLGWMLLTVAAWLTLRTLMLMLTKDHHPPAGATAGGALFAAVNLVAGWGAFLIPFHCLARAGENAWDVQAVICRLWILGVCVALFRLALHPSFMGRLLSRKSSNRALRWLGSGAAMACIVAAVLATLPYLAGLDNLGRTVLNTVEASFSMLAVALIGTTLTGWAIRRKAALSVGRAALVRALQTGIVIIVGGAVVSVWAHLINQVVLAPNAPPPVQNLVHTVAAATQTLLRIWHRELTPGMTVSSMVRGILVFAASFWVSGVVRRLFHARVLSRTPMDEATRLTFTTILGYLVILLGFMVGLNVAGSSLQNLALLAGAVTVGLGFGLQNIINNFVSSLLIHFGRTIRVGDYLDVGGTRGTVREIGLRNTVIATDDGITVLVPNGTFVSSNIINWTNPSRRTRLHIPLAVLRQADLTTVTDLATSTARNHALVLKDPAPTVEVRSLTATQVNLDLLVWTERPEQLARTVGELSLALDRALREKGWLV